ncbi:MAG: S24/S26 family peptidase [Clostridia bacterium]|nr:S24/S26 family peptidase [Clostridia bacterium]
MRKELTVAEMLPLIEETIGSGGVFTLYPKGDSMKPLVRQGLDAVELCAIDTVTVGDIVLFRRENGEFVLHRIVDEKPDGYVFCGDNQCVLEGGIKAEQFIAKVSAILREGKRYPTDLPEYLEYVATLPKRRKKIQRRATLRAIKKKIFGK